MLFSRPTLKSLLSGFTDYHSHILPGVDDGVKNMEMALDVLAHYEEIGISTLWCTPHIMEDVPNKTEDLKARFEELQASYDGPVKLHLAAEYMMDELFEERLASRDLLPLGEEGNQLLVETSYFNPPMSMDLILRRIKKAGYFPVLAHPERYVYMDDARYKQVKGEGVLFQLNIASLVGAYGPEARHKARYLLRNRYYNLAGSDLHSLRQLEFWNKRSLFLSRCNL